MNPLDELRRALTETVEANQVLKIALHAGPTGWLDMGLPPAPDADLFPCVRIDGLQKNDDKLNSYTASIKLWSRDMSFRFLELVEEFGGAIEPIEGLLTGGYLHRPEEDKGLNCALFPITFYR